MHSYFENLFDALAPAEIVQPPQTTGAFIGYFLRPIRGILIVTLAVAGLAWLAELARLRGLGHFQRFGPLKINELITKVFTTVAAGARAAEWNLGRELGIADQRESAEGACEWQSDTFRLSWQ